MIDKILQSIFHPKLIAFILKSVVHFSDPKEALHYLFSIDKGLYSLEGQTSVRYGKGIHSKHHHIHYHDFFIENMEEGQSILDIGSGNGVLDKKIAEKFEKINLVGIELNKDNFEWAKKNSAHPNITFVNDDALKYDFKDRFDVVILSNVLEHIKERVKFLKKIQEKCQPKYFLIRVPMFERDWRIPLQKELGLDYFLDSTHFIEYRFDELEKEFREAGLKIEKIKTNWGEYWIKAII